MASQKDRDRLKELNEQLRFLIGITPQNGVYLYQGTRYNKRGYDDLVKKTRKEISDLQEKVSPVDVTGQANRQENFNIRADRLSLQYDELASKLLDIEQAIGRAGSVEEETNLRAWAALINNNLQRINGAIRNLRNGLDASEPTPVSVPSLSQARRAGPPGPATGQIPVQPPATVGGVPGAGQPMGATAGTTATGLTAAQRGEAGIMPGVAGAMAGAGEQPVDLSGVQFTTTPAATTTPPASTVATPAGATTAPAGAQPATAGPAYVDPATGVSVQPGGQIGGEDRALPNGGAVVNGIYIPPGIDYTALGQAMQAAGIQIPAEWEKAAREMFGSWYDVFKNDPEMSAFLQRLMREPEMSDAMFMAELQKTNWWRTTSRTARDFARRQVEDPETLNLDIAKKTADLKQMALDRGFTINDAALNDAALKSIQFGFSDVMVLQHLAQLTLEQAQGPSSLVQGFYGQNVRELAAQYGVPLSDTTLTKWVSDIATGNQSLNSFDAYARDLARNLYPSLAKGFDNGLTFGQMTNPYAQVASRILDIPGETIDFTDPKWAAAFTMRNDKGEQMQMSFGEWSDYLRTNSAFGYEYTDEAVSKAYNVANDLAKAFGRA